MEMLVKTLREVSDQIDRPIGWMMTFKSQNCVKSCIVVDVNSLAQCTYISIDRQVVSSEHDVFDWNNEVCQLEHHVKAI